MEAGACLTADQIIDLWNDRLPDEQAAIVSRHLDLCPVCLARAEALSDDEAFLAYCREHSSEGFSVPAWVGDLAQRMAVLPPAEPTRAGSILGFDEGRLIPSDEENLGTEIGPYTICERLGEGGMGIVYIASQSEPIRRQVALKIIKPGMNTKEVISRFATERQALAMMAHPHIAKILDGGTTDAGRPYFVMELIEGVPITEFCDREMLDLRERLQLFRTVCLAVQHAHQRGIIHRDLKPTNILVERHDGLPVPKVIDFGISKAIDPLSMQHSVYTQFAQVIGTPLYMSPEQAAFSGLDIDTRSDVYSLGVILYELLTGKTPFEKALLRRVGFDEMRRIIRDDEPSRPSSRVSTLDHEAISTISDHRRTDPRQLSLSLRKELDWIVMRALEKDRNRRYESASSFAEDIERYLNDEPVQACPPSVGYRFQKYVKRHKVLLATTALVLISAILGTGVSLSYAKKANLAAETATTAQIDAEQHALEADQAQEWSRTLLYASDMKLASDAMANGDDLRAAELLKRHVPRAGEKDLRGFEWHYFQKQINKPRVTDLDQGTWVDDVEASPDGKWLATTAASGTIRIYETANWMLKHSFATKSDSVHGLAWSPDGQRLAAACGDGSVQIWQLSSGLQRLAIKAHADGANDVAFSPDGKRVYSCGEDTLIKGWDSQTGQEQIVFSGHLKAVNQIALSPDGNRLVTASSDETFAVWDSKTAERLTFWDSHPHEGRITCVAYSQDGRFIAAGSIKGLVLIVDMGTGHLGYFPKELDGIESVMFLAGGQWLATVNRAGAVHLYPTPQRIDSGEEDLSASTFRWVAHTGRALSLTAVDHGQTLITGGRDGIARIWKPDLRSTQWSLPVVSPHVDFECGPENRLYLTNHRIELWDLGRRQFMGAFGDAPSPWKNIACSEDGRFLAAFRIGQLALFDLGTRQIIRNWPIEEQILGADLAISKDGRSIIFEPSPNQDSVFIYQRENSTPPRRLSAKQCGSAALSKDGRWLAAVSMNDIRVFDLQTNEPPRDFAGHSNSPSDLAFSPDGQWLASVSHDRLLKLWHLATGEERFSIVAHAHEVRSVTFSPDGKTIATRDMNEVNFWHTATAQPIGTLAVPAISSKIRFSFDGLRLVASSKPGLVIYDAASPIEGYIRTSPASDWTDQASEKKLRPAPPVILDLAEAVPVSGGDYDGDGKADLVVYLPKSCQFLVDCSGNGLSPNGGADLQYAWGEPGDIPLSGDYDGDGKADLVVFRPKTCEFHIDCSGNGLSKNGQADLQQICKLPGEVPLTGDYDGDGKSDLTLFQQGTKFSPQFHIDRSGNGFSSKAQTDYHYIYGDGGDIPLSGDYDGDGGSDLVVYKPAIQQIHLDFTSNDLSPRSASDVHYTIGEAGDIPLSGDYDGDGKSDLVIYTPAKRLFHFDYSGNGFSPLGRADAKYSWSDVRDLTQEADPDKK